MICSQSNELELIVQNVQHSNHGIYRCLAGNKISTETDEISINIMTIPKVKITASSEIMMDGLMYSLRCDVDDTKEQKVKILWLDGNGIVIQDVRIIVNREIFFFNYGISLLLIIKESFTSIVYR